MGGGGDVDDASRHRQRADYAPGQQQRSHASQHDDPRQQRYQPHHRDRPQYDGRESPVNARLQQQPQLRYHEQAEQNYSRYDDGPRNTYIEEQADMREVSHYPPPQQYSNAPAHGQYSSSGGGNGGRSQPRNAGLNDGPAYTPAPVATASMADLQDSITNSTTTSDGRPAKKPKRVYETALGQFSWSDLMKRKYWKYYAILIVIGILVLLAVIFHDDIIKWMQPVAEKIRDIPGGWAIWVGIMFVISFPPLFGQEVLCLLCGLIYGLWWGFAIISLGTMLGEWGNFLVFKYWCSARSAKTEEKDVTYACMCRVVREGGFRIAFMARLSAIPGHLTTPVFAACGMGFWVFSITAFLTLPKQLMAVYLGTVFGKPDTGEGITTSKIVEWVVLGISFVITIIAAWYIYAKMAKWRPIVLEEQAANRRKAQEILERDPISGSGGGLEHLHKGSIPRVTLSDEAGIVKSPSSLSQRFNAVRWPIHGQNRHGAEDRRNVGSDARRMEEGSFGDIDGAEKPLVSDSAAPAGYRSSSPYIEGGLYPTDQEQAPYHSSAEDVGYGYADGGETRNSPRYPNQAYDTGTSANVSMKWQPPHANENTAQGNAETTMRHARQRDHAREQEWSSQSAQYSPAHYRQHYHSPVRSAADPASQQSSSLPNSSLPSQSMDNVHYRPNLAFSGGLPDSTPQSASALESASPLHQSVQSTSYGTRLSEAAQLYPTNNNLMPQPSDARRQEKSCHHDQRQAVPSRYPDMIEPRNVQPISNTEYRSNPAPQYSSGYRSEPDPSRPSPYHTGHIDPEAAYRGIQS